MKEQWREIVLIVFVIALSIFLFTKNVKTVSENIIITEICPSGCGATDHQWIEIYNKSTEPIDLSGWKFWEGGVNHGLTKSPSSTVTSTILLPGRYAIIAQNDVVFLADHPDVTSTVFDSSWTTLNKTGEEVGIKKGSGASDFIEKFVYAGVNNYSLERVKSDGDPSDTLEWKEHPSASSPGKQNYWWQEGLLPLNHIPIAHIEAPDEAETGEEVVFDASESSDFEGLITSYQWMIENTHYEGVSVTYSFSTTGTKQIILTVFDSEQASSTVSHAIEILPTTVDEPEDEEESASGEEDTPSSTSRIFINEFLSDPNSGEKEWIELYNAGEAEISLEGFFLYDAVGKIATVTGTISSSDFRVIYLSSSKLNQSGDTVLLKNSFQAVADTVIYGEEDGNALIPGKGHSIARVSDGEDGDVDSSDFAYTITPTPGSPNNITTKEIIPPSSNLVGGGLVTVITETLKQTFTEGSVLINEFVAIPGDNESEFVELFNTTNASISLEGWFLQDGSLAKTALSGTIGLEQFFVIEKPKGSLNNTGDLVTISDPSGKEIDRVVYGSWNGEDSTASVPAKGSSIIRINNTDTGNDEKDFYITETITKGKTNILTQKAIASPKSSSTSTAQLIHNLGTTAPSGTIYITEIFPNPTGADTEKEFIEIFNSGSSAVDLSNWQIGDSAKKYTVVDTGILPHSFHAFYRTETGISLNNSGEETVSLWDPSGAVFETVAYSGMAANDQSYSKFGNEWSWVNSSTPGTENIRATSSTLVEVGGDPLDTGIENHYSEEFVPVIVEILPNPVGSDTKNEYIELFNPYDRDIYLVGLSLDDGESGSKPYPFSEDTVLKQGEYRAFYSKDTKLSLTNSGESVRIVDSDGLVLYEIEYVSSKEGKSYTYGGDMWFWTTELTPDKPNPSIPTADASKSKAKIVATKPKVETTLTDVRNFDVGTVVSLTGTVVVEPGVMSSQYFYVAGSPGLQIYSYKKDFPALARGDKVKITGELAETSGEVRLKIDTAEDIQVVGQSDHYIPLELAIADIDEPYEGWLTEIKGEVTGIKGSYVYLDDGTDEVRLYIRGGSGIDKSLFTEGARASVTGIVQETKSGYMVSPRDVKDVRIEGVVKGEKVEAVEEEKGYSRVEIVRAVVLLLGGFALVLGIKLYGSKILDFFKSKLKK